ncbi:TrbG/VirB9 family P-type conjugative transfer protein [Novosphingopyxis sp.]|uniref:TrbG/VirB9 family P-type conjugative transfer protein n=1 Tax=Novosphingopyxis sp. TaxID=2709690 RepID=UPI003B59402E
MQAVTASPLKRIRLTGVVGRVANITFNPKEAIYRVAFGTAGIWEGPQASGNGQAMALKNNLPLWPVQPGHTNLVVTTVDADGHEYPYQFDLTALPAPPEPSGVTASLASTGAGARAEGTAGSEDAPEATFGLIVKNSEVERAEQAMKAQAASQVRIALAQQRQAAAREAQARTSLAAAGTGPETAGELGPACNPRYVGWGSAAIAPVSVCDNGQMTFLRYQGQLRPPSVFVLGPDGKEQALIPFMRGDTLVVPRVAKEMHLYSGQTALYIFNRAYNPAGINPATGGLADPGTGTVSPGVRRVLRSAGRGR